MRVETPRHPRPKTNAPKAFKSMGDPWFLVTLNGAHRERYYDVICNHLPQHMNLDKSTYWQKIIFFPLLINQKYTIFRYTYHLRSLLKNQGAAELEIRHLVLDLKIHIHLMTNQTFSYIFYVSFLTLHKKEVLCFQCVAVYLSVA